MAIKTEASTEATQETPSLKPQISISEAIRIAAKGGSASLKHDIEAGTFEWIGEPDAPLFLGFPYILGDKIPRDPLLDIVPNLVPVGKIGIPLIHIGYSPEHECNVFLRADIYQEAI